jgi:prephenate dehydratase
MSPARPKPICSDNAILQEGGRPHMVNVGYAMAKPRINKIAFQGEPGANSHLAARDAYPRMEALACPTFEDALAAVKTGAVKLAIIPIENSLTGRVADIHHLLPHSGLYIVAEHFERVRHQLLTLPGVKLSELKTVHGHVMALGQCCKAIRTLKLKPVTGADTGGAARQLRESGDRTRAVIASKLAAEIYGLRVAKADIEDAQHNTTHFVVLAAKPGHERKGDAPVITSFVFRVRNVPAALYKALGGFATNGVNMTKLESYQLEGSFNATVFYADIEGHPDERPVAFAMEELHFFSAEVTMLGTYPASPFRADLKTSQG